MAGYLAPVRTESAQPSAKMSVRQRSVQVAEHVRPVVMFSATAMGPTPGVVQVSRYPKGSPVRLATANSLQAGLGSGPECSGGADGGMDSTGSQCSDVASADTHDPELLAAAH